MPKIHWRQGGLASAAEKCRSVVERGAEKMKATAEQVRASAESRMEHQPFTSRFEDDSDMPHPSHADPDEGPHISASKVSLPPLHVRVCSWNLHGSSISHLDELMLWLAPDGQLSDIYVVGVQELVELSPKSVIWHEAGNEQRQAALEARIEAVLFESGCRFQRVCAFGMVGLAILVYARADIAPYIQELDCDRVKTGLDGKSGNKGSVCVRFSIGQLSMCFMNVHLASGQHATSERSQNMADILADAFQGASHRGSVRPQKHGFHRRSHFHAQNHNFVVILGDFNSRLNLPKDTIWPSGPPEAWLEQDQLLLGMIPCLRGFSEAIIGFPPTYKYVPGTDELNAKRLPAWCDRVVYKTNSAGAELLQYDSCCALNNTSDHWPVAAQFSVSLHGESGGDGNVARKLGSRRLRFDEHQDVDCETEPSMSPRSPRSPRCVQRHTRRCSSEPLTWPKDLSDSSFRVSWPSVVSPSPRSSPAVAPLAGPALPDELEDVFLSGTASAEGSAHQGGDGMLAAPDWSAVGMLQAPDRTLLPDWPPPVGQAPEPSWASPWGDTDAKVAGQLPGPSEAASVSDHSSNTVGSQGTDPWPQYWPPEQAATTVPAQTHARAPGSGVLEGTSGKDAFSSLAPWPTPVEHLPSPAIPEWPPAVDQIVGAARDQEWPTQLSSSSSVPVMAPSASAFPPGGLPSSDLSAAPASTDQAVRPNGVLGLSEDSTAHAEAAAEAAAGALPSESTAVFPAESGALQALVVDDGEVPAVLAAPVTIASEAIVGVACGHPFATQAIGLSTEDVSSAPLEPWRQPSTVPSSADARTGLLVPNTAADHAAQAQPEHSLMDMFG